MRVQERMSIQIKQEYMKAQEEKHKKLLKGKTNTTDKTKKGKTGEMKAEMSEVEFLKWLNAKEIEEEVLKLKEGIDNM